MERLIESVRERLPIRVVPSRPAHTHEDLFQVLEAEDRNLLAEDEATQLLGEILYARIPRQVFVGQMHLSLRSWVQTRRQQLHLIHQRLI